MSHKTFESILEILKTVDYKFQEPPKMKSNMVEDHIGKELAGLIGKLDFVKLNRLFQAAHYLKIYPLKRCIAALLACRVFVEPTLASCLKMETTKELTDEKKK